MLVLVKFGFVKQYHKSITVDSPFYYALKSKVIM